MAQHDQCSSIPESIPTTEHASAEVELDAGSEAIWDALTTGEGLSAWFGPGSTIDPIDGGAIATPDVATGRPRVGFVTTVDPQRRLAFTWWPSDDPGERSSVSITLTPASVDPERPATVIRVVEERCLPTKATASVRAEANAAWAWRGAMLGVAGSLARH